MRHKETGCHSIGAAISSNGTRGPFTDYGKPIVQHPSGTIDVHWFKDPKYVCRERQVKWERKSADCSNSSKDMM